VRKAAEGIPLVSAIFLEILAYLSEDETGKTAKVLRALIKERGRYTVALLCTSFAVAAVYTFQDQNLTLFISILVFLIISSFLFLSQLDRFTVKFRLLALAVVTYLILWQIDPVGSLLASSSHPVTNATSTCVHFVLVLATYLSL
jgi:hypothetical protein